MDPYYKGPRGKDCTMNIDLNQDPVILNFEGEYQIERNHQSYLEGMRKLRLDPKLITMYEKLIESKVMEKLYKSNPGVHVVSMF